MPAAANIFLLILLFIFLELTRRKILTSVHHISLFATGHAKPGIYLYSFIFLPGVIIHELSHLFFATFLGVPTGKIEIFPTIEPGNPEIKLGYVQIAKTDFLRRSLIGAAPTIVGIVAIYAIADINFSYLLSPTNNLFEYFSTALPKLFPLTLTNSIFLYMIFVIASTMFTSRQDRDAWPVLGIFLAIAGILVSMSGQIATVSNFFARNISQLFNTIGASLFMALTLNFFSLIVLIILEKIMSILTGKRISR